MVKEDKPMVLFKHLRTMHQTRQAPAVCNAEKFTLENVAAYNIQIDTGDTKTSSIVTLREVPSFLIEAFSKFEQLEGYKVEGVFRKEGNYSRCKEDAMPVFFGAQQISSKFLVHDVCAWIKKFFRELRQPLFANRETKLIQFVEDLHGDMLVGAFLSILDRLPASHMGTLGYLMRCLQEIAESSHLHQMTVENLATVFAPSLFRGIQEKETKMSKKRNGSQENLLRTLKRNNDLQVQVVKVLIENAEKIGAAKDCYKASRSASDAKNKERKLIASSLQRHAEAAKPPTCHPYGGAEMKINAALLRKNSRSTTNLSNQPSTSSLISHRNSDDDSINSPRKAKQGRSNSVVRMVKNFKKSLTNLTSDAFMSTPDPPGLANKRIPMPTYHQQTPITQSVSMDPSTTTSSDDTISNFVRRKHPEYLGVNFQEIRKVMSPKDSKKRPPIPSFDNRSSSNDEKKENEQEIENSTKKSTILRKRSSSGSKKPMGLSNATNIQRAATQMNKRDQPLKVDRSRRSTAPVKTSIKRMQPNSKASGLTLSRKARSFQRRSSSRKSGSNTSTSSSDFETSNDINSQDILEQKGIDARRRRRMKKKENSESLTNVYNSSTILTTPNSPKTVQNSISPVLSVTTKSINANIEPTSDLPLTSDISSPELQRAVPALVSSLTPQSSMISLITKKKTTPPLSIDVNVTPQREPLPLITPSPDSGCSLASSKQLQTDSDHIFVKPELPKRFIRPAQVDIRPTGTSIYFPTESSLAKQKSPVRKSPLPHISARRSSSAASSSTRATSKSPSRQARPRIIPASPSDHKTFDFNVNDTVFNGTEKQMILNSTTNDECHFPEMGRPSIAQIKGTGVVNRRIQQFKKLSNVSTRPTYGTISENNSNFVKPMGKPASHGLLWKKTNITDSIAEQPTKSHQFGSSRAKSVTSIYSTQQNFRDSLRPSVSATSQISSSRIKNVECGTIVSKYPKNS